MLRKIKKDHNEGGLIPDSSPNITQKNNSTSLFSIPCLFVGFTAKALCDCDSVRSPTSPLDSRVFSGFGSSWWSQRSDLERPPKQRKCRCAHGVGLGIVGSLAGVETHCIQNFEGKSESKNILLGSQLNLNPHIETIGSSVTISKSSPTYAVLTPTRLKFDAGSSHFAIESPASLSKAVESDKSQSHPCDSIAKGIGFLPDLSPNNLAFSDFDTTKNAYSSGVPQLNVGDHHFSTSSSHSLSPGLSVNGIEFTEDYTCVITHGPNPKTKHIYRDFVFEGDLLSELPVCNKPTEFENRGVSPSCKSPLPDDFLSFCYGCRKKLQEGEDIYMYRGERAFCSPDCRMEEIIRDEGTKDTSVNSSPPHQRLSHPKDFFPPMAAVMPEY